MSRPTASATVRLASSHVVTVGATLAAIVTFVGIAGSALPQWFGRVEASLTNPGGLSIALLLNVALILFGWRRAKDLKLALAANAEAEKQAHAIAYSDFTTGLANRRALVEAIEDRLRGEAPQGILLVLDLDHFKKVNDLHGHRAGDQLLRFVAATMREAVPPQACCARLGGDEFGILLPRGIAPESASAIARSLLDLLSRPIPIELITAHISASAGLSQVDGHIKEAEEVMRRSDIALYEAKRLGRNCFVWFDAAMEEQLTRRTVLEAEMRAGIEAGEFVPFFQPLISLGSSELKGFEVLARWRHPVHGIVEPLEFIGIAEATGLIAPLSLSVMRQAISAALAWPNEMTIAVNISPIQFRDPQLAARITKLLTETGFPAARLEIEITESSLLEDHENALAIIESLKNQGIRISLDDFGTGYATLTQLRAIPFDRIKIDKSFVSTMLTDSQSDAIVETISSLGRSLRLPITAEGVESDAIRRRLVDLGCSDAQGWLFGRAIPAENVQDYFASQPNTLAGLGQKTAELEGELPERRDTNWRASPRGRAA